MEDAVLVLTERQELGDKAAKAVLAALAGVAVTKLIEKGYDKVMTIHRLKKLTSQ